MPVGQKSDYEEYLKQKAAEQAGVQNWTDIITNQYKLGLESNLSALNSAYKQDISSAYNSYLRTMMTSRAVSSDRYQKWVAERGEQAYKSVYDQAQTSLASNLANLYADYTSNVTKASGEYESEISKVAEEYEKFNPYLMDYLKTNLGSEFDGLFTTYEESGFTDFSEDGKRLMFDENGKLTDIGKALLGSSLRGPTGYGFEEYLKGKDSKVYSKWQEYGAGYSEMLGAESASYSGNYKEEALTKLREGAYKTTDNEYAKSYDSVNTNISKMNIEVKNDHLYKGTTTSHDDYLMDDRVKVIVDGETYKVKLNLKDGKVNDETLGSDASDGEIKMGANGELYMYKQDDVNENLTGWYRIDNRDSSKHYDSLKTAVSRGSATRDFSGAKTSYDTSAVANWSVKNVGGAGKGNNFQLNVDGTVYRLEGGDLVEDSSTIKELNKLATGKEDFVPNAITRRTNSQSSMGSVVVYGNKLYVYSKKGWRNVKENKEGQVAKATKAFLSSGKSYVGQRDSSTDTVSNSNWSIKGIEAANTGNNFTMTINNTDFKLEVGKNVSDSLSQELTDTYGNNKVYYKTSNKTGAVVAHKGKLYINTNSGWKEIRQTTTNAGVGKLHKNIDEAYEAFVRGGKK